MTLLHVVSNGHQVIFGILTSWGKEERIAFHVKESDWLDVLI